ncbi:hypothetical protein LIER_35396 [Lithospermum erythrorhizon]|uniref:ATP-dependent DNA helicase n=1 Tax=Lithospermum erythrorhizon TaxID=34254 RepID=A0AAV3NQ04_LITER
MAEDFSRDRKQLRFADDDIMHKVLMGINNTLKSLGKEINDYHIVPFSFEPTDQEQVTRHISSEMNLPIPNEDLHGLDRLNDKKKYKFDIIFNKAITDEGGAYFVDGPGGTGKSYLYKVLLAHIRSHGFIALVVATSGIASSFFIGGHTAHSRFKIPIDDLCKNTALFGGKLVVFGGDFRQVLLVVRCGSRSQQIEDSMVSSDMWSYLIKIPLTLNMRACEDPGFMEYLMRIGNGEEVTNEAGQVRLPLPMVVPYTTHSESLEALISYVYPDLGLFASDPLTMMKRAILSPRNDFVDDINSMLIDRMVGEPEIYISDDRAKHVGDQGDYLDYLNSLEPNGLPQHRLILKPLSRARTGSSVKVLILPPTYKDEGTEYILHVVYKEVLSHVQPISSMTMKDNVIMIPDVKQGLDRWTMKVTVTEVLPTFVGYQHGTRYKRYILTDDQGNTIPEIVYGTDIRLYDGLLNLHGVYDISNAAVKPQTGNQVIKSQRSMFLSICDQQIEHHGPILTVAAGAYSVIVVKRIRVKNYQARILWLIVDSIFLISLKNTLSVLTTLCPTTKSYDVGATLASTNTTSFTIDPPIEEAITLKSWFDSVRDVQLPKMLAGCTAAFSKDLTDKNIDKMYLDFWTRAFLQPTQGDLRLHYIGCPHYFTGVNSYAAGLRMSMDVYDHSGCITAGAIKSVAEQILQCNASQLDKLLRQVGGYDLEVSKTRCTSCYYRALRKEYNASSVDSTVAAECEPDATLP